MRNLYCLDLLSADSLTSCVHALIRNDGYYEETPLLANFWFMSARQSGGDKADTVTLRCFQTV